MEVTIKTVYEVRFEDNDSKTFSTSTTLKDTVSSLRAFDIHEEKCGSIERKIINHKQSTWKTQI